MNPVADVRFPAAIVSPRLINVSVFDLELVKKELQFFIDHEVPQVKFVDRTFNCKHSHSMANLDILKRA